MLSEVQIEIHEFIKNDDEDELEKYEKWSVFF